MSHLNPIAYTYNADTHCPECAEDAFGLDSNGFIPETAEDSEGNEPGAIFPWSEWHEPTIEEPQSLVCGSCGNVIDTIEGSN